MVNGEEKLVKNLKIMQPKLKNADYLCMILTTSQQTTKLQ